MSDRRKPFDEPFDAVISLGPDCRPAYQVARDAFRRASWRYREKSFKRAFWRGDRRALPLGRFPFDSIIMPPEALVKYLRNDFAGFFDRACLSLDANGIVVGPDGIVFFHGFSREDGRVTPAILDSEYESEAGKYAHMIAKLRELLRSRRRILYVTRSAPAETVRQLAGVISAVHSGHDFFLLSVVETPAPRGLTMLNPTCAIHEVSDTIAKVDPYRWEGDDDAWHGALGRIRVRGDSVLRAAARGACALLLPAR